MWRLFAVALVCFSAAVTASERSPAQVRIFHERSIGGKLVARVETVGKTHHLKLKRTLVPSVRIQELVVGENGSVTIQEMGENQTRNYYEDDKTGAFLFMNDENTLEGMVTDSLALHYEDNQHTVSELDEKTTKPFCDVSGHNRFPEFLPKDDESSRQQSRTASFVVEVLAYVDSTLRNYKAQYFTEYMQLYWKMVDRRFKTVTGATIEIRLTSIRYCLTTACDAGLMDAADPYYAQLDTSTKKFAQFLAQNKNTLEKFDVAHLMTRRDLFEWVNGQRVTSHTGNVFTVGCPCIIDSSYAYNSGISEDNGLWIGTLNTAHQLGHNLGAYQDGEGTATSCSSSEGYLMSNVRNSANTFFFSSCSSAAMVNTYYQSYTGCLKTIDDPTYETYPNYISGNFMSVDTQCQQATGVSNAIANPSVSASAQCYLLKCQYVSGTTTLYYTSGYPALEGTPCAGGGFCKDGSCQPTWQR